MRYEITTEVCGYGAPNANPWYAYGTFSKEVQVLSEEEYGAWYCAMCEKIGDDFILEEGVEEGTLSYAYTVGHGNNAKDIYYIVREIAE